MKRSTRRHRADNSGPLRSVAVAALAAISLATGIAGCGLDEWAKNGAKVGPNYEPPPVAVNENWIDYQDPRVKSQEQDLSHWWGIFDDATLNALLNDAYSQNLSLRAAGERVLQTRARLGFAKGNIWPQLQEAAGSATANKVSDRQANNFGEKWFNNVDAGFNVSWELDLWGRFRRSIESASADLDASVADYDDVLVVLLADVTSNYIQYRTFEERIAIARRNVTVQEQSYQLASDKLQAGASTERDVVQSKQVLEQTRASIPQFEASQRQSANALCVLLGIPAQDLSKRLGEPTGIPSAPPELALGIPADLLRRRPDIRRFERQAASQSALIGVAKSDLYPHIAINGSIGVQGDSFADLFHTPGSFAGSIGPSFRWNILNYGRIENTVAEQEARFREAVAAYQQAVLQAGREAEDAAVGFLKAQERAKYLGSSVTAAARTVEISYDQYKEGVIDFTPVFLFEGTLAEQEDALAVARSQIALNLVDLYRAMGGGWEMRLGDGKAGPTTQSSTTRPAATRPTVILTPLGMPTTNDAAPAEPK